MSKHAFTILAAVILVLSSVAFALGQDKTVTKTFQNADGTYTVIEYPIGKETIVTLNPVTITGATGTATILRDDNGTQIKLNLSGLPSDLTGLTLYAVDPAGVVTSLGPIAITNGVGTFTSTTPLNRFMLVASPEAALVTYDPNTKIFFRSAVPAGFTVIPRISTPVVAAAGTPTTVTKTVQNVDGTFTVIEYPVGKEVMINLNPVTISGAKGVATILRDDNGTRIKLNLTGLPSDLTGLTLYAVDPAGVVTALGPISITKGIGTFTTTTPLNRFMLVASPEAALTTYDPNTKIFFRSAVPEGFAVIPHTTAPVGETVGATAAPTANAYTVPMLNIPAYKKGDDTKLKVNFTGALSGARANVFIEPHKKGAATEVRMRFHELKDAPKGKAYILWAVSPDNQFVRLGQIVNLKDRNEAEIKAETTLSDFGLLVTMEDLGAKTAVVIPAGPKIGVIELVP